MLVGHPRQIHAFPVKIPTSKIPTAKILTKKSRPVKIPTANIRTQESRQSKHQLKNLDSEGKIRPARGPSEPNSRKFIYFMQIYDLFDIFGSFKMKFNLPPWPAGFLQSRLSPSRNFYRSEFLVVGILTRSQTHTNKN